VTDDPIEAAYFGVYVWKNAVEKAGMFNIEKVIPNVLGQKFPAPGGAKMMDTINHHTWKACTSGRSRPTGSSRSSGRPPAGSPRFVQSLPARARGDEEAH